MATDVGAKMLTVGLSRASEGSILGVAGMGTVINTDTTGGPQGVRPPDDADR